MLFILSSRRFRVQDQRGLPAAVGMLADRQRCAKTLRLTSGDGKSQAIAIRTMPPRIAESLRALGKERLVVSGPVVPNADDAIVHGDLNRRTTVHYRVA